MSGRTTNALAVVWGFAEATLFFIVPDVLLSWVALRRLRAALLACVFALLGALVGGTAIWIIAQQDPEAIRRLFVLIPAIDSAMLSDVRSQLPVRERSFCPTASLLGSNFREPQQD